MSKELKLGLLAIFVLVSTIWGYKYIQGNDLFSRDLTIETSYPDVSQLTESSPVYIKGFRVGQVEKVYLNPDNYDEMVVKIRITSELDLPKSTVAVMQSEGLVGGKGIALKFDKPCNEDCLVNGDKIKGETRGILGTMLGDDDLSKYGDEAKRFMGQLGDPESNASVDVTIRELSHAMKNLAELTASTNTLIANSSRAMTKTIGNIEKITANFSRQNEQINSLIANFAAISSDVKKGNIDETLHASTATITETRETMKKLQETLELSQTTFSKFNGILADIESGEGSLSKLLTDKKLYDNLEFTSKNMALLLQDMRLNPRRYVSLSVFGKENKDYIKPEDDPAFKEKK